MVRYIHLWDVTHARTSRRVHARQSFGATARMREPFMSVRTRGREARGITAWEAFFAIPGWERNCSLAGTFRDPTRSAVRLGDTYLDLARFGLLGLGQIQG